MENQKDFHQCGGGGGGGRSRDLRLAEGAPSLMCVCACVSVWVRCQFIWSHMADGPHGLIDSSVIYVKKDQISYKKNAAFLVSLIGSVYPHIRRGRSIKRPKFNWC